MGIIVFIQAFLLNTELSPSYQPAGKSPQYVLSDPPQPTKSITTDFSDLHLYSIFPQNREIEKHRLEMIGKKRCAHALTENVASEL